MRVKDLTTDNHSIRPNWDMVLPIPNDDLIATVSGGGIRNYFSIGEAYAHVISQYMLNDAKVLDVGCGCAKIARFLYMDPTIDRYMGFDIIKESIDWCKKAFRHVKDFRFCFDHADIYSDVYNPDGKLKITEYEFPVDNESITFAIAASVFTHLLEYECEYYLSELSRTVCECGKVLISIHDNPNNGKFSGNRSKIDIDRDYFLDMAKHYGFGLYDETVFKQRIFILERRKYTSVEMKEGEDK